MKTKPRRIVFVKLIFVAAAALLAVAGLSNLFTKSAEVRASSSGPSPAHTGAPKEGNCTACHTSFALNSGAGSVSIGKLPVRYAPNQQIPITVTVSQSDAVIFGFQLTAIDADGRKVGTYTIPAGSANQIQTKNGIVDGKQRQYVEHTTDGIIPSQFGAKSWTFLWNAPALSAGRVSFYAAGNAANSDGSPAGDHIYTTAASMLSEAAISNFDGDGKSDLAVFRPSNSTWYLLTSAGYSVTNFGAGGDIPVAADYNGDGKSDIAVFRPSNGNWYLLTSAGFMVISFGANGDIPAAADYDGDGKTDIAVFRPSNGRWYMLSSLRNDYTVTGFGAAGDIPVAADYNGDGKSDIAVFRPSNGTWYLLTSAGYTVINFGANGDIPVSGDYDGDGKSDIAVFRPSNSTWYILSSIGYTVTNFGAAGDVPVAADYDGDGKSDIAVFRPSNGNWYLLTSAGYTVIGFGANGDIPTQARLF